MRYLVLCITTVVACFGAYFSAQLGLDYIDPDIGRGLHPLLAFSLSWLLISISACLWFFVLFVEGDDPEIYELTDSEAVEALAKQGIYINR